MLNKKKLNNEETEKVSGGRFRKFRECNFDRDVFYEYVEVADLIESYRRHTDDKVGYDKLSNIYQKMDGDETTVYTTEMLLTALVNEVPSFALYLFEKATL